MTALGFSEPSSAQGNLVAVNTLPWARSGVVQLPQLSNFPRYGLLSGNIGLSEIRPLLSATSSSASLKEIMKDVFQLSNSHFTVEISSGVITSLYDKRAARQVIPKGSKAAQLVIYDDKPLYWQAWDVEVYHLGSRQELHPARTTIAENGPHRASVITETQISDKSWIKTTISLSATTDDNPSYIEMDSEVEWREDKRFLKVEFPVDVRNTEASYETQYGIVRRPTHYNTTWDMAKFEVCCHKWADLSEAGYGVSILNDSKYGFATQGNVMRLSLLRAPKAPDAHADMGRHHFRYAIMPHSGAVGTSTVRAAFNFNNPVMPPHGSGSGEQQTLFPFTKTPSPYLRTHEEPEYARRLLASVRMCESSSKAIILDAIKRGEDDEDVSTGELPKREGRSVVVRLYDSLGGKCSGKVLVDLPVRKVVRCNLLEDDEGEVKMETEGFGVELRPFEVATYRLML